MKGALTVVYYFQAKTKNEKTGLPDIDMQTNVSEEGIERLKQVLEDPIGKKLMSFELKKSEYWYLFAQRDAKTHEWTYVNSEGVRVPLDTMRPTTAEDLRKPEGIIDHFLEAAVDPDAKEYETPLGLAIIQAGGGLTNVTRQRRRKMYSTTRKYRKPLL